MGLLDKLKRGLSKTSTRLSEGIGRAVLGKKELDESAAEDLEEVLIEADIGVRATAEILEKVTDLVARRALDDRETLLTVMREAVRQMVNVKPDVPFLADPHRPLVVLVVGVNGVGKTTTIGKLGALFRQQGQSVLFGAADTFRAAAIEQLAIWADRIGADLIRHQAGADPSAVAYDCVAAAAARGIDTVLIDTAGRLHTKDNLMGQLERMKRVIAKVTPDAPHRVVLVLDGTNGQNAISQAREFVRATGVTDLIITKLDGTARGGVIIPILQEFGIPVSFVGVGEGADDLIPFDPDQFVDLLFSS